MNSQNPDPSKTQRIKIVICGFRLIAQKLIQEPGGCPVGQAEIIGDEESFQGLAGDQGVLDMKERMTEQPCS